MSDTRSTAEYVHHRVRVATAVAHLPKHASTRQTVRFRLGCTAAPTLLSAQRCFSCPHHREQCDRTATDMHTAHVAAQVPPINRRTDTRTCSSTQKCLETHAAQVAARAVRAHVVLWQAHRVPLDRVLALVLARVPRPAARHALRCGAVFVFVVEVRAVVGAVDGVCGGVGVLGDDLVAVLAAPRRGGVIGGAGAATRRQLAQALHAAHAEVTGKTAVTCGTANEHCMPMGKSARMRWTDRRANTCFQSC